MIKCKLTKCVGKCVKSKKSCCVYNRYVFGKLIVNLKLNIFY